MAKNSGTPTTSAFERDFGYLLPFMDKVAAAAANLQDAAAREELTRLMAEEKVRWARIQQLLTGASGRGATPTSTTASGREGAPQLARASADNIHRVAPTAAGLTVGSLKSSR